MIVERRKLRPEMTLSVFLKITLLAQLERVLDQILYYTEMKYTTATFAIAMCNILPALTFFMAWIFRLEQVNIRRLHSQVKIIGTLVTVGGAMVMTLVNGPPGEDHRNPCDSRRSHGYDPCQWTTNPIAMDQCEHGSPPSSTFHGISRSPYQGSGHDHCWLLVLGELLHPSGYDIEEIPCSIISYYAFSLILFVQTRRKSIDSNARRLSCYC